MCDGCEARDRLLDDLVWAVDHLGLRARTVTQAVEAADTLDRARVHVARWHASRVLDLRDGLFVTLGAMTAGCATPRPPVEPAEPGPGRPGFGGQPPEAPLD